MAEAPAKPKSSNLVTMLSFFVVLYIMINASIRDALGNAVGYALGPVIGFGGKFPVLTIMLGGTLLVLLTTLVRHFTTDWLDMAKSQAVMRHYQKEMGKARKDNNTYRLKKLQEMQPEILQKSQQMQQKQLKTMPLTMIVVIPLYAWMFTFVTALEYLYFAEPWNPAVSMFGHDGIVLGSSVFPHWILLYMTLSVPLGALAQKTMKYVAWRERWQKKHPEVHG